MNDTSAAVETQGARVLSHAAVETPEPRSTVYLTWPAEAAPPARRQIRREPKLMWSNPRVPYQLANRRKRLEPPGGKPILVNLCMNVGYWPFDKPMPRGVLPAPHGAQVQPPDIPNYSWVEYGMRCGMPRFMDALARRGLRASALMNAQVADVYPALMDEIVAAGWEIVGHGWFQQSLKQADDEVAVIRRSLARLQQADGRRVCAWLGPGIGETP